MYTYKNKHYDVMLDDLEMKNPDTGKWLQAVLYIQQENGKTYTRCAKDFYKKFKKLES